MSFLNFRRLPPPRKVWKIFTEKLQIKLHKLNRSKAIKKHKPLSCRTPKKLLWPFLSIQTKKFKLKPKPHTLLHLNKRKPPVYMDHLFIESLSTVKELMHHPTLAAFEKETNKTKPCFSSTLKRKGDLYQPKTRQAGSTKTCDKKPNEADDMWESMGLASPQTQGINERAEEFIARFRAQMHQQELLARRF